MNPTPSQPVDMVADEKMKAAETGEMWLRSSLMLGKRKGVRSTCTNRTKPRKKRK